LHRAARRHNRFFTCARPRSRCKETESA
jgi:hypothetical protein